MSRRPRAGEPRRSPEKRAAIIESATACFLGSGYLGTTVDEIAARAGVSKQTVYQHFGGKEQLFTAVVVGTIDAVGEPFFDRIVALEETSDLEEWLLGLARELAGVVKERRLLDLRRLVIAEVARFPKLGRMYYDRGPGRTIDAVAVRFEQLRDQGLLQIDDVRIAAQHFNWLVLSIPMNRAMFMPRLRFTNADLDAYAREAVKVFLAAYRERTPRSG